MAAPDPFNLGRFAAAQDEGGTYERALGELRAGRKSSHWMWFVFPQLAGLGRSQTARFYAIASLDEARAYLAHPVLGPRLLACCDALLAWGGGVRGAQGAPGAPDGPRAARSAEAILGPVDALKLRSSLTLFAVADPGEPRFAEALAAFYDGEPDPATGALLASA